MATAETTLYYYTLRNRPFTGCEAPRDAVSVEMGTHLARSYPDSPFPVGSYKFGLISFERKLSDREITDFELIPATRSYR